MPADAYPCELCTPHDVLIETSLAYVRHDNNSLSRGHVLVIPKRHARMHVHVHLIPRYTGDVPDPRGGIRCVLSRDKRAA